MNPNCFGRAVEAKLREKNTHSQPKQPLTEEQIFQTMIDVDVSGRGYFIRIARAHGIKEES